MLSHDDVLVLTHFNAISFAVEQLRDSQAAALIRHFDGSNPSSDWAFFDGLNVLLWKTARCTEKNYPPDGAHLLLYGHRRIQKKSYSPDGAHLLLYVHRQIQKEVMQALRDDPTAGHF